MIKLASSPVPRAIAIAVTFTVTAIVLSSLKLGPFHSLLTLPPGSLRWPRVLTVLVFGATVNWAVRGNYRPAQRAAIVALGALVLSDFALVAAYFLAQLR